MKCANCKKPFDGGNYGFLDGGDVVDICSTRCRGDFRLKRVRANAERGVAIATPKKALPAAKPARKLSRSEIKRKLRPLERDISKAIENEFRDRGHWNTRIASGAIRTDSGRVMRLAKAGTPDRIAAAGLTIWIEVKRAGEDARPDQLATIARLQAAGALAFVLDDHADCDFIFNELQQSRDVIHAINLYVSQIQQKIDKAIATNRDSRANKL